MSLKINVEKEQWDRSHAVVVDNATLNKWLAEATLRSTDPGHASTLGREDTASTKVGL